MSMDLKSQRKVAAKLLKCGERRVWMDPARSADIKEAITSADVRRLIRDGVIAANPKKGISSFRKKKIAAQKKKGRRRGTGSVKGKKGTRNAKKTSWIRTIRSIRKLLVGLKTEKKIDGKTYRQVYMRAKSGYFRSKAHVLIFLERNGLIAEDANVKKEKK